jgi:hypothetical protein
MQLLLRIMILFLSVLPICAAQKLLQMDIDKFGGRVRFEIGEVLQFQLDGKPEWYQFKISDLDPVKQEIIFDEIRIPVSRITKLFFLKRAVKAAALSLASMIGTFGISWTAYAIYGLIVASPMVGPITLIVGAAALGISAILFSAKFIWKRKYKITEKRRLRIIDLTIYPDKAMFRTNKKDSSFSWVI